MFITTAQDTGGKDFLETKTERKNNTNTLHSQNNSFRPPIWRIVQFESFSMDLQVPQGNA